MKSVDELMRLAGQHASAHAEWVLKGSESATQEDATYIALRSALEEVVRDAARYRWLRGGKPRTAGRPRANALEVIKWEGTNSGDVLKGDALDAAIDAAMAKEQQ